MLPGLMSLGAETADPFCRANTPIGTSRNARSTDRTIFFIATLSTRRNDRLLHKGNRDRDAIFRTQVSRDVTLSGRVFDQIDMAGTDRDLLTSRNLDLSSTAERNHELAPGTGMPLVRAARRPPAEL